MIVVFRPEAEDDVLEARYFYESRQSGLGREFSLALESLLTRIAENPFVFPTVYSETKRAVFSKFPYAPYFRVSGSVVVVLAIHGRQHPARWQIRS